MPSSERVSCHHHHHHHVLISSKLALTRGTHQNRVYTVVSAADFEDHDFHLEHVVRALDRSLAKTAAIDYLDPPELG